MKRGTTFTQIRCKEHHPDALPATEHGSPQDQQEDLGPSAAAHFSYVPPQSPEVVPEPTANGQTHKLTPEVATAASASHDSPVVLSSASHCVTPSTTTNSATPALLRACPLTDPLVHPGADTPARTEMALPRARLLTSASLLAQIEEKERRKQLEQEEREKKRKERMEKKEMKEQEQKRKAEEKVKKVEEVRQVFPSPAKAHTCTHTYSNY